MQHVTNQVTFIFLTIVSIGILYLLTPILTPFLMGGLLAYLANPLVKHLEKWGVPHLFSVISIFVAIICIFILLILMLAPLIQKQAIAFINTLPQIIFWLQETVIPWLTEYVNFTTLKTSLSDKSGWIFGRILQSGYTMIDWVINLILTPVVTFYLLRDWNTILNAIKDCLPQAIKSTTIKLVKECDAVLSQFFRGQLLVMLSLCFIYGIGLTLIGLKVGFILGIIGGLLSIVPYLGSIFVVAAASITAVVQFGTWQPLLWVLAVYFIGHIIESCILTPYLVGNRIGLHPVAVIFAIMAGGSLFGFFGVLAALPVGAVIVVMLRFIRKIEASS